MPTLLSQFPRLRNIEASMDRTHCVDDDQYNHWQSQHVQCDATIMRGLPSGSGFDGDPDLLVNKEKRIVIDLPYHHMDKHGGYDGWVTYRCTITPSFIGTIDVVVRVHGYNATARKHADDSFKDYVAEVLTEALLSEV